jgi:hypothetical protein
VRCHHYGTQPLNLLAQIGNSIIQVAGELLWMF